MTLAPTSAVRYDEVDSPLGPLLLTADEQGITSLSPTDARHARVAAPGWTRDPRAVAEARAQLAAYFAGELFDFDLPLHLVGTDFQRAVWRALGTIPYGEVRSYADIALAIGRPTACRAVGLANGRNPVFLVVPCHRVIGTDGALRGYGGGVARKQQLLDHERGVLARRRAAAASTPA